MKFRNITTTIALVGALAMLGCGDDGGGGGTVCDVGDCASDTTAAANCEASITACNTEGTLTSEACDDLGVATYCMPTGGGSDAGAGGIPGCNESLCAMDAERRQLCEDFVPECIVFCEGEAEACGEDECLAIALVFICNEQ